MNRIRSARRSQDEQSQFKVMDSSMKRAYKEQSDLKVICSELQD